MDYKVYMHTFPDGSFYIGTTKNSINVRKDQGYQHNKLLKDKLKNFGWASVKSKIIEENLSQKKAFDLEIETIEKMRKEFPSLCLNISNGGKSTYKGLKHTEDYKKKMSNLYKGRSYSQETLRRMKEAHKNERKPVVRIFGNIAEIFESLSAAAKSVNGHKSNVSRACKSGKPYKGYLWKWYERG